MSENGVRPTKLSHWAGILLVAAVVWHNPGGSAEFAITALDKAGSAISTGMNAAGFDGESDYFTDNNPPTTNSGPPSTIVGDPDPDPDAGDRYDAVSPLNGRATDAVVGVIHLHELVEAVLVDEGPSS